MQLVGKKIDFYLQFSQLEYLMSSDYISKDRIEKENNCMMTQDEKKNYEAAMINITKMLASVLRSTP